MGDNSGLMMEDISKAPADSQHYIQEHHVESLHDAHPFHDHDAHHVMVGSSVGEIQMMATHHDVPNSVMEVAMDVVGEEPLPSGEAAVEGEASAPHEHPAHAFVPEELAATAAAEPEEGPATKRQRLDEAGAASVAATASESAQSKKIHNEQWNEMLERLMAYKAKYGNCLVPKRFSEDGKLGTWVETQRVQYKRLPRVFDETLGIEVAQPNKRLTGGRLQKLNDLGFCWSAKNVRKAGSSGSISSTSNTPNATKTDLNPTAKMTVTAAPSVPASVSFMPNDAGTTESPGTAVVQPATNGPPLASTTPMASVPAKRPSSDSPLQNYAPRASNKSTSPVNTDAQWEDFYARMVKFKEWHGHCLVPRKYEADPKLAAWVESQRVLWNRDYNANKDKAQAGGAWPTDPASAAQAVTPAFGTTKRLTPERKQRLDDLGFVWSLRSKRIEDHWDEMFKQLVEYKNLHGDCLVPSRYEANLKLGKWVETQRYEWTKLKRTAASDNDEPVVVVPQENNAGGRPTNPRLTPERLRRLESIGFEWKVKNKMKRYYDKQWDGMFLKLLEFKQAHGHCNVPKRYPDNVKLGTWVHTQRIQYRKLISGNTKGTGKEKGIANGELSPGGAIDPSLQYTEENASEIAAWSVEQAQSYRLTDARRIRLEEVGFCWSAREGNEKTTLETSGRITRNSYDDQWDAMFDLLVQYKEQYRDCLVPKRYQANPKLGTWVDTQRVQYKKMLKKIADIQHKKQHGETMDDNASEGSGGKEPPGTPLVGRLTQERIQRLQNLGFVWSLRDDWAKHYEELKAYKQIHGHCNVPARFADNRRLGIWVSAQRQQYKILQQQKHLQPGQVLVPAAIEGEEGAIPAAEGAAQAGDSATNSKARRSAPLTQERIDLLNSLGFVWTIRSRDSLGESWNQRLHELRQFKQQYGHCLVPSRYDANPELGIWVGTQRTQYRLFMRSKETGVPVTTSMNEDRIRELEELGFVWALRGSIPDEAVAAAEAAATAVEIADQVAVGVAAAVAGHGPNAYHAHHMGHHAGHHPYAVHMTNRQSDVNAASTSDSPSSHSDFITAI